MHEPRLVFGSMFSGVGMLDLGLCLAGIHHAWFCEREEFRRGILAQRWPGAVVLDDVRTVGADSVPRVDGIVGGFPCKGASSAGKRNGFDHPETVLWREMVRAIRELEPRYVVIENVANLLALHDGAVWGEVLGDLAALGFDAVWDCIPAAAVGAPHRRDRVFAVATHPGRQRGELRGGPGVLAGASSAPEGEARERQRARNAAGGRREDAPDAGRWGRQERAAEHGEEPTIAARHAERPGVPVEQEGPDHE